jgi:hypothetical protein
LRVVGQMRPHRCRQIVVRSIWHDTRDCYSSQDQ